MKIKLKPSRPRNLLHNHPLMRKGGVHKKSHKALRHKEKQKLKSEWGCLIALTNSAIKQLHSLVLKIAQNKLIVVVPNSE